MKKERRPKFFVEFLSKIQHVARIFLLMLFTIHCFYSLAQPIVGKINFKVEDVNLITAIEQLNELSGKKINYKVEEIAKEKKRINVDLKNVEIVEAIKILLEETNLVFTEITNGNIAIGPSNEIKTTRIKGKVIDVNKLPLPGVTVMVKGTSLGSVTNTNGVFDFSLPSLELPLTLRLSFIGMDSQEVKYTGQDSLVVTMHENSETLGEVVVTGFGTMDKRLNTSAITSLKMDDIMVPGVSSLDQMLEGRVPGMVFMQNSGQVGATPRLRIRGTSTILGNQEPLWVVDDIIQDDPVNIDINQINDLDFANLLGNAISGLNPADIDRIDILKDASATAMYGARAANGVIVVTTKKGDIGAPRVSYNFSSSVTRRPYYSDRALYVMNSQDRVELSRELMENGIRFTDDVNNGLIGYEKAFVDYFKHGTIDINEFNRLSSYYQTVNTDWFKLLMRNSFSHNHSLSVSGGTASARYNISVGYTDEQGAIKKEYGKRFTTLINLTTQFKGTTISFKASGNKYDRRYSPSSIGVNTYAYSTSRAIPQYTMDGERSYYLKSGSSYNIFDEIENSDYKVEQKGVNFNLSVRQNIFDFLRFTGTASYNYSFSEEETWFGEATHYVDRLRNENNQNHCPFGGELQSKTSQNNNYTFRGQLDFNMSLDSEKSHYVFSSLGGEIRSSKYKTKNLIERGYMKDRGGMFPSYGSDVTEVAKYPYFLYWLAENGNTEYNYNLTNMVSSFWSASYAYMNKYIFNINGRVDFSNAFGDRSREKFNPIWSVSTKWDVKKDFFEYVSFIGNLDFRASYGTQGNMRNDQPTRLIFTKGRYDATIGKNTSTVKYFPNPDLKWERTHSINTSVDFSFFNRAITGTLSYFYKKTINAFYNKPISDINGKDTYVVNKGNIENKGFEISLNVNPVKGKVNQYGKRGFYWRFDPQLSQVLNKLLKSTMNGEKSVKQINSLNNYLNGTAVVEGVALNSMFSYRFKSLDSTGRPTFYELEEERAEELTAKYSNLSKEEIYMCYLEKSGRRVPIIQGGLSNVFGYRNFQLSMNFSYSFGNKVRLFKLVSGSYSGIRPQVTQNVRQEFKDRWRVPGDEEFKIIPATQNDMNNFNFWRGASSWVDSQNVYVAYDNSDIRVVSGNYLRLQSLTFSYKLDDRFLKKMGLVNGYFSFSGSNLFTIAHKDFRGQDPSQSGSSNLINLSVRPKYTVSFNVSF